jgi:hypothetical protein
VNGGPARKKEEGKRKKPRSGDVERGSSMPRRLDGKERGTRTKGEAE